MEKIGEAKELIEPADKCSGIQYVKFDSVPYGKVVIFDGQFAEVKKGKDYNKRWSYPEKE